MIVINSIGKKFGPKVLFDGCCAAINPRHRTALVGPNGSGKTMLARMICGQASPDSGAIAVPASLHIAHLAQEMTIETALTPPQLMLEPFARLLDPQQLFDKVADSHGTGGHRGALDELSRLQAQQRRFDVHALPSRTESILAGLGIPCDAWQRPLGELSGGFRMRVVLGGLLLQEPDFLVLDEPTNHLDLDSLIWFEKFVQKFKGGMLIISHDRDFLKRITTRTVELRQGHISVYAGPIDEYMAWKEMQDQTESKRVKNLEESIRKTERFVERFKAKATKASQARSRMKTLDRLRRELPQQTISRPGRRLRFAFPPPPPCVAVPLAIEAASAGYGGPPVFAGLTLSVNRGDKVAIIGPNGAGKSTLLRMCAGLIAPSAGRIRTGGNAIVRYYGQHRLEQLDPDKTLYDTIAAAAPAMASSAIQSILGLFLFSGEDALKTAGVLSGGEKARLSLASILADPGNVLLLDEPTNHLDIESVERLADALATFEGTALIVSHDEFFLNRTATRILEIRPGTYRYFPGSLADYRSYIEEGYIETLQGPNGPAGGGREGAVTREKTAKEQRVLTRESRKQLERRIRKTEEEVQALEEEIAALKKTVDDPANAHDFQLLHETLETTGGKQAEADRLTDEWGRLQEELDTLNSENPA